MLNAVAPNFFSSTAYHEAGHMAGAALQGMPLRDGGICIDGFGNGVAYYWQRNPGDLNSTEQDQKERRRTIVAILSAHVSQTRYFVGCPKAGWADDNQIVSALLDEMYDAGSTAWADARADLWQRAEKLVGLHWPIIDSLARRLLAEPLGPLPPIALARSWTPLPVGMYLSAEEVLSFFREHGIPAQIRKDSEGSHHPSDGPEPYYDSLA